MESEKVYKQVRTDTPLTRLPQIEYESVPRINIDLEILSS
jgi:hypothetical protein